jgi:DNA-binding SARP family transcriptional activator/tetratricopeptide (TPR) repeat protein
MLLGGKFLKPISAWGFVHRENLDNKFKSPITLIQAPSGYLLTESLAAILEERDRKIIWLRFGWEDFDPATCLLSLIEAFQIVGEKVGTETLEKMRKLPGPVQGWQALFTQLGQEIEECLPEPAFLVLENMQFFSQSPMTLALLIKHFLPALPNQIKVILISQKDLPGYPFPKEPDIVEIQDLKLSPATIKRIFEPMELISDKECIRQTVRLMTGSPVGLVGICKVGQLLGEDYVQEVVQHHTTRAELCNQIARDWLSTLDEEDVRAVATLLIIGYNHPAINQSQTGKGVLAPTPWSQELDKGWIRPHRLWLNGIKTALRTNPSFSTLSIQTVAYYLCQSSLYITGIELLFASRAFSHAAEYLAEKVDQMLNLGQWELLNYWINLLPETILQNQPRLLHASGEIKSASGDLVGAGRDFQLANEQYFRNNDDAGKVSSLLALSTLATHLDDAGEVWASAYKALQIAQSAALPELESSAELQVGILALQTGDVQQAIQHLERAAELSRIAGDTSTLKHIDDLHALALEHEQHQQQRMQQQQNYLAAQQAEQAHLQRLQQVIRLPLDQDLPDWSSKGWLQAPLMLKLGGAVLTNGHIPNGKESLLGKISAWLHRGSENGNYQKEDKYSSEVSESLENRYLENLDQINLEKVDSQLSYSGNTVQPADSLISPNVFNPSTQHSPIERPDEENLLQGGKSTKKTMSAYMLGEFRLVVEDTPVERPLSGQSGALLKYLIHNHERRLPRDELMEVFWPDVEPESARNRLNVTLNKIRTTLRRASSLEIILFEADKYFLNPELKIWIDVDQFEKLLVEAKRLKDNDEADRAIRSLEVAANLYQGDFLVEDIYEEWTVLIREQLRLSYLDALYQLSRHYFEIQQYTACAALCQSILVRDNCREDIHTLLMRCYAYQRQIPLALRQYQVCVQALREELGVGPSESTVGLYEQLRRREITGPQLIA